MNKRTLLTPLMLCFALTAQAQQSESKSADASVASTPEQASSSAFLNQQSIPELLEKLRRSASEGSFEITFVRSIAGNETVPYLWRHSVLDDGTTMEQLSLQNGPGRELLRVDNVVSVFEPDVPPYSLNSHFINSPLPSALIYDPASLVDSYEFVAVGRARIAGNTAQQIRIVSKDASRFSYQMWLDEETGLPLKLNMLDGKGQLLEQIQVTHFDMLDVPHPFFERVNRSVLPEPMMIGKEQTRSHEWEVGYLPEGMKEVKRDKRRLAVTGQIVEYLMFTDGLVDVSIYIQSAQDGVGSNLALRHELDTFLTLTDGNAQVTVVGEIPLKTATDIANSLSLKVR